MVLAAAIYFFHPPVSFAEDETRSVEQLQMKIFSVHGDPDALIPVIKQFKSGQGRVTAFPRDNKIIVYDYPDALARIGEVISQLDVRDKQVDIKVVVAENAELTGYDFSAGTGIIPGAEFGEMLRLVRNDSRANIRSEMSLKVVSGKPAVLGVGQEEIYPGSVYHDEGITVVTPTRTRSAGNFLEVLPKVNNDGTVLVTIRPSVSKFLDSMSESERSILTQVIVKDGDTIMLGGMDSSYKKNREGISLTGLSAASREEGPRNIVMFLTVTVDK
jgi:type II secretory pathway component GspD/PulD (secretin)